MEAIPGGPTRRSPGCCPPRAPCGWALSCVSKANSWGATKPVVRGLAPPRLRPCSAGSVESYRSQRNTALLSVPCWKGTVNGFTYSQTVSPSGVTSKNYPSPPLQMSVLPLSSRWAPEMDLA